MNKTNKKIIQSTIIIGIIILLIWIISAEYGETHSEFSLANTQPSCQYNAEGDVSYWVWWNQPTDTIFKDEVGIPIPPKFSCYREGGWPSWGCCPDDIQCAIDQTDPKKSVCYGFAPDVCSEYNAENYGSLVAAESYCRAFNINTAIRSVEKFTGIVGICSGDYAVLIDILGQTGCNQYTSNCRCYWDEEECKSASTSYTFCDDVLYSEGNCTQEGVTKDDQCNEKGLITYIWKAIWNSDSELVPPPSWCVDGTKTFDCMMIKLSFFSFMNILLFVLIVIVIYYFIDKKNKGKKNTK